jgi:antitoxin ParD1/3/4
MAQLNVSIPPALKSWIDARVAEGRHSSASDYIRDLVRRDQDNAPDETAWLRSEIERGFASGMIDMEPEAIVEDIIAAYPAQ